MAFPANTVAARNVYPTYAGADSLGVGATTPFSAVTSDPQSTNVQSMTPVERALQIGMSGNATMTWVVLAALLILLMWAANKFDGEGNYSNIRLSAYNIFITTLSAIIGLSLFKVAATKYPVPGLSAVILAA